MSGEIKDVLNFTSCCPVMFDDLQRAEYDLQRIKDIAERMSGNIGDYGIKADDKGIVMFEVDESTESWAKVTRFTIMPIKHTQRSLQAYIDWLERYIAVRMAA